MRKQESKSDSLKVNEERVEAAEIMVNKFNSYFTSIANSVAEKIQTLSII